MTTMPTSLASEVPIGLPLYGATFRAAVSRFWKKYATFSGRASKSEYWWAVAFLAMIGGVIDIFAAVTLISTSFLPPGGSPTAGFSPIMTVAFSLVALAGLAIAIPAWAVTVRRLHDTNRTGFFIFFGLIPWAGPILLVVFAVSDSNVLGQRFDSAEG